MKLALIGYGKMGKAVEQQALALGHEIVFRTVNHAWTALDLIPADVCIDFSHASAVVDNLMKIAEAKKNAVIGTTGWNDQFDSISQIVRRGNIGLLHASNFSTGVFLVKKIMTYAAALMQHFPEYDAAAAELHHNQKKDSPSGTAIEIVDAISQVLPRAGKIPISSVRCGSIPGTHTLLFDCPCDTISISHEARNRDGFARGAVQCAEWLIGKSGIYTFSDYISTRLDNEALRT